MAHKTLIGGTSYEISGGKTLVNGTAYSISGGKTLVGGTAYNIGFNSGTPVGDLSVGSSVYMNVNGGSTEFLVVHQGLPSTTKYSTYSKGTWLLMKDIYTTMSFESTNTSNDYANSDIHNYLNNTFINLLDSGIKSIIKDAKLPYTKGTGSDGSLAVYSEGLVTKIFLLSYVEVMDYTSNPEANTEGAVLSYFDNVEKSVRLAYLNGTVTRWWLRSPVIPKAVSAWFVHTTGNAAYLGAGAICGVRPALILPSDAKIDENFNVIA